MDLAVRIVSLLCEGMTVLGTARVCGVDKQTVIDLTILVGEHCEAYMRRNIKAVHVEDIQADEIWQHVFCKRATAERAKYIGGCGDSWCYTAIERGSKLLVAWHLGRRNDADTREFCWKLSQATRGEFYLSTDGWPSYPMAIWDYLGERAHYGVLVKIFREPEREDRRKYSPSKIIASRKVIMYGIPDRDRICTSHAERMNGSIRHFCKRMARLTYAFSKRWRNHRAALGLFFCHYNYCRKHKSLKGLTPAVAHGLENHVWSVRELLDKVMHVAHT